MVVKRANLDKSMEERAASNQNGGPGVIDKLQNSNDQRQLAIKCLLETDYINVEDKLTVLKTAHHVDKDRFQSAFRSLMGPPKS